MSVVQASDLLIEEKYVVKKTDGEILAPGTFFVIKQTDLFAASGLWAYAHALATVIDLADTRPILNPAEHEHLMNTADYASRLATLWQQVKTARLPD